jgi:predicted metal-dependent peptidase
MDAVAERVAAAKLWLISQSPGRPGPDTPRDLAYLATAVYALSTVPTPQIDTIRADEHWRLYVNPDWATAASVPEVGRELAHIVWHLLMDHAGRARAIQVDASTSRDWHMACDLTIADTLAQQAACPEHLITEAVDARRAQPRLGTGRSAEDYYALLSGLPTGGSGGGGLDPLDDRDSCGSAADGIPRASDLPPDADVGTLERLDAEVIRERVAIDYLEAQKGRGDTPGGAARWAKEITRPTIPWEPLLAKAVRRGVGWTSGRHEPTWTRPSRRQSIQPDVLRPGWRRPVPAVAMVIDTSASIDDKLLGLAMGEVDGALHGLGIPDGSITVLACDAAVGAVTRVRKATEATLVGGGGTDLRVGIAAASQLRPKPDLIVVFTDGYTPWPPAPPPGSAVIAAMLARPGETLPESPGWATRINCTLPS